MKLLLLLLLYPALSFSQDLQPDSRPRLVLEYNGETIGFDDTFVFRKNPENGAWYTYMEVAVDIMNASVYQEKLIIGEIFNHEHYVVDLENRTIKPFVFPERLFEKKRITSLIVEKGGSNRYLGEDEISILYLNFNGKLGALQSARAGKNPFDSMGTVKEKLLQKIVMEADRGRDNKITMADLDIKNRDIKDFRRMVSQKLAGTLSHEEESLFEDYHPIDENKRCNFYIDVAENLDTISPVTINRIFGDNYRFATHMTFNTLEIGFEDNTRMTITSCNYRPGYFHTPLLINYEGLLFNSRSVKLGRLINKLTQGTFLKQYSIDGKYAVLQIADYLYRVSLEKK